MKTNKGYERKIHKILKTYNSILVKCKNIPILSDKNIVIVEDIGSMVNAQIETRKPILYFQEEESISFILLDGLECYVYIVKANEQAACEVEQAIENFEYARNTYVKEIVSKIEKVLLGENAENKKVLTAKEQKYLESVKEGSEVKSKERLDALLSSLKNQNGTAKKEKIASEISNNCNEKNDANNANNVYLVPVKKKFKFFNFFNRFRETKRLNP